MPSIGVMWNSIGTDVTEKERWFPYAAQSNIELLHPTLSLLLGLQAADALLI